MTTTTNAVILADTRSPNGQRLTTLECTFGGDILAEVNTHRMLCLAGDAELEFDLPAGQRRHYRRIHRMRLDEFVDKWINGARRQGSNSKREVDLSWIDPVREYTTRETAAKLGLSGPENLNSMCRTGGVVATQRGRTWWMTGQAVLDWRRAIPEHSRFQMRERLQYMQIRIYDETTREITTSRVVDAMVSGVKQVFELHTDIGYSVAGSTDHRVLTSHGWSTIGQLREGDLVAVRRWGTPLDERADNNRLRKIDGRWRSVWQREVGAEFRAEDPLCRRCGECDGEHVHHIVSVNQDPSRAFDRDNVVWLCAQCHQDEHRTQGWQKGNRLYGGWAVVTEVTARGEEQTYDLTIAGKYPNFLANGIVVHNSRNSASMRAIPVRKVIDRVRADPFIPSRWSLANKGMSAAEYVYPGDPRWDELTGWHLEGLETAIRTVEKGLALGLHKQDVNYILRHWMWHTAIISATDWGHWFDQRMDEAHAHPEIYRLAVAMHHAMDASAPVEARVGDWHTPLVGHDGRTTIEGDEELADPARLWDRVRVSAGRCARVSYLTHDGRREIQADLDLYERLAIDRPPHLSPLEHPARVEADDARYANYQGFKQLRWFAERGRTGLFA